MSWLTIALLFVAGLFALAVITVAVIIAAMLISTAIAMRDEERRPDDEAAETPELGADILPDGSPNVQRSTLWPPACRLREDYITRAQAEFDWKAAEQMPTRKAAR